jgi:hypothetical protein
MVMPYVVYGQRGTGSVAVEATLVLLGEPYELKQPTRSEDPEAGDLSAEAMAQVNPMQQLPAAGSAEWRTDDRERGHPSRRPREERGLLRMRSEV